MGISTMLCILQACVAQRETGRAYPKGNRECSSLVETCLLHQVTPSRSKPSEQNTARRRLAKLLLIKYMGKVLLETRYPTLPIIPSGMRGLPALLWDGSVLDAGQFGTLIA